MAVLSNKDIIEYVENNIGTFHKKKLDKLENLKLLEVLKRKNPYLYKAKNILTSQDIVKGIVDAYLSSSEETIFGDWLEGLAIYINNIVFGGQKSGIQGIDLEFFKENTKYIVSIKSGPNWGNSSQIAKMQKDFEKAKKILRTSNARFNIESVNGCCYGICNSSDKGSYFLYCGQAFWEFISGDSELYIQIIEPLGYNAMKRNQDFEKLYANKINLFTQEFSKHFCDEDGSINWTKLIEYNSKKKIKINLPETPI